MSSAPLKTLPEELRHLDISAQTHLGELKAIGGYADIHEGVLTVRGAKDKKVAIKRFRTFADPEKDFEKV
jgi:hypothetical protein